MFDTLEEIMAEDSKTKLNMHLLNFYRSRQELEEILNKILESVEGEDEELVEEVQDELNKIREIFNGEEEVYIGDEKDNMHFPKFRDKKNLEGIPNPVNENNVS